MSEKEPFFSSILALALKGQHAVALLEMGRLSTGK